MKQVTVKSSGEWLKVLGKGMITIPKKWRQELGLEKGEIVRAQRVGSKVIIEAREQKEVPYRVYSDEEIKSFVRDDKLSSSLVGKIGKKFKIFK